jgi:hypothetical protein
MSLRRIQGQWVFVSFDNAGYKLDVRVFPDITSNLYDAQMISPIHGTDWGRESDDAVAQLYGPSIVPGSRLDGGFHILLSQWHTDDPNGWPYHASQFKIPVPGVPLGERVNGEVAARAGRKRRTAQEPKGGATPRKTSSSRASRSGEYPAAGDGKAGAAPRKASTSRASKKAEPRAPQDGNVSAAPRKTASKGAGKTAERRTTRSSTKARRNGG